MPAPKAKPATSKPDVGSSRARTGLLRRALSSVIDLRSRAAVNAHVRQMRRRQWFLGLIATAFAALMWYAGGLDFLERLTMDWRVWYFDSGALPPSPAIALVVIDDAAQTNVGRWPWPRSKVASVVRELSRAGAKVVALDITFEHPSDDDRGIVRTAGDTLKLSPDDAELALAIRESGRVIGAASMPLRLGQKSGTVDETVFRVPIDRMVSMLIDKPDLRTMPEVEALRALNAQLLPARLKGYTRGPELDEVRDKFRAAVTLLNAQDRSSLPIPQPTIEWPLNDGPIPPLRELAAGAADLATVTFDSFDPDGLVRRVPLFIRYRDRLWPSLGLSAALRYLGVPLQSLRVEQAELVIPVPGQDARRLPLTRAVAGGSSFDGLFILPWPRSLFSKSMPDASVRGYEWQFWNTESHTSAEYPIGRVYEPIRLAVEVSINLESIELGVSSVYIQERFGQLLGDDAKQWQVVREKLLHAALDSSEFTALWTEAERLIDIGAAGAAHTISENTEGADETIASHTSDLEAAMRALDPPPEWTGALDALKRARFADENAFEPAADTAVAIANRSAVAVLDRVGRLPNPIAPEVTALKAAAEAAKTASNVLGDMARLHELRRVHLALPTQRKNVHDGIAKIAEIRSEMKQRLGNKLVIVGWTATGANADFIATSIDPRTPGPHVHAAVANAVLTGFSRSPVPVWADLLAILVLGTLGTLFGIRATVVLAPLGVVVLIVGWFLLSGAVLWDYLWVITAVAGPSVSAFAGLGVVMLHRLTVEQRSRRKTEERFKSYLAPAVVDILVNNPELQSMKPQRKTLSIMFTDLAGFTTTAERLGGARTAEVLAQFLGRMTEIVQSTGATLDKYIGDAIMAFWGAPIDDAQHARHACRAAIEMIRVLDGMNAAGEFGDAGTLVMRVGIATGEVMVGDFGNPPRNSSYTVIGDTANLASRLEGANKAFGSRILLDAATRDLVKDEFAFRIIGDVKVKGKIEATRLYELVGDLNPHGERTAEWLSLSEDAARLYREADLRGALGLFRRLAQEFGDKTLADLYQDQVDGWNERPKDPRGRPEGFDGTITLTEK